MVFKKQKNLLQKTCLPNQIPHSCRSVYVTCPAETPSSHNLVPRVSLSMRRPGFLVNEADEVASFQCGTLYFNNMSKLA